MPATGIEIQLIDILSKQLTSRGTNAAISVAIRAAQSFLGIQKKTSEIEKTVEKLTKKYYEAGIEHLQYAENSTSDSNKRSFLLKAINEFVNASKVDSKDVAVNAKFLISYCFASLGEEDTNAINTFNEAYRCLHNDFFAVALTRGRIAAKESGIDPDTFGSFNQNNDLKLIEIYTDAAKDLYRELHKAAAALKKNGHRVDVPSEESKIEEIRDFYQRQSDLNYQRSRGM